MCGIGASIGYQKYTVALVPVPRPMLIRVFKSQETLDYVSITYEADFMFLRVGLSPQVILLETSSPLVRRNRWFPYNHWQHANELIFLGGVFSFDDCWNWGSLWQNILKTPVESRAAFQEQVNGEGRKRLLLGEAFHHSIKINLNKWIRSSDVWLEFLNLTLWVLSFRMCVASISEFHHQWLTMLAFAK